MLKIKKKIGLIWLWLKNGYLGKHSFTTGVQLSSESEEKKTEEAQQRQMVLENIELQC